MIEKSVWSTQNVARFLDTYDEWVYSTASDSGIAMLTWTVEIVGRVWIADLGQVFQLRGQRVSAESEIAAAKRSS